MIGCVRCAYILGLLISGTAAQWDGDMNNAREDEYFGNRLREHAPQEDWGPVAPQRNVFPMVGGVLAGFLLDWKLGQRGGKNRDKALDKKLQDDVAKLNKHLKLVIKHKQDVLQKILDAQQVAIGDLHNLVESAEDANVPRKDYAVVLELLDAEEFNLPDEDGDGQITKQEFERYVKDYVATNPGASRNDMPAFEDFDVNRNGKVDLKEWTKYVTQQRAEQDQANQEELERLLGYERAAAAAPRQRRAA